MTLYLLLQLRIRFAQLYLVQYVYLNTNTLFVLFIFLFLFFFFFFFFSSRRRHTRFDCDWSSDVCSSDLSLGPSRAGSQGRALLLPVVDCVTFDTAGSWPFEWKAKWAGRLASIVVDARSRVRGSGQWADIAEKLELFLRDLCRLTDVCLVW